MTPSRGEVWWADLDPTKGREQAGRRPVLVVSVNGFNGSPAELVLVLPITSRQRKVASRVPVRPPEGGLTVPGDILCDAIRSVSSTERLHSRIGSVSRSIMAAVEDQLRVLLGL